MQRGYIKLWRASEDNKLYFADPFTRWQAWQDMILRANHKKNTVIVRGIFINLERGQLLAGEEFLAKRWKWSRDKVRRFMSYLASETIQQIRQQKNNVCSIVTIVNYEIYQSDNTTNNTANRTTDQQQTVQQKNIHKNDKNDKNKEYIELRSGSRSLDYVKITQKEKDGIVKEYGSRTLYEYAERLQDYIEQIGVAKATKKYVSHSATLRNWMRRDGVKKIDTEAGCVTTEMPTRETRRWEEQTNEIKNEIAKITGKPIALSA